MDYRLGYVGLGLTLVAARFSYYAAFVVAALHVAVVLAYGGVDLGTLPTVLAGLLGGMLITPWAVSAALTWVIVAVASTVTLFELEVSLWYALIPLAVISTALSFGGIYMARWEARARSKRGVDSDDILGDFEPATQPLSAVRAEAPVREWDNLFV